MARQPLFLLAFIVIINGCAILNSEDNISMTMENSYSFNGISKEKAIAIAKEHCLATAACYKNCNISSPRISEDENWRPGQWIVSFRATRLAILDHTYFVFIDKKTGEIVHAELTK